MINYKKLAQVIGDGGVAVMPTDTIYGVVGSALRPDVVSRLYKLRRRNLKKPMIILIGSIKDLDLFGIWPGVRVKKILAGIWPGKVSIILACRSSRFQYLHRGKKSIAFRLPQNARLRALIKKTGPLVAPSANPEGQPPARNIREAKRYFGKEVNLYADGGTIDSAPSRLIEIRGGKTIVLR